MSKVPFIYSNNLNKTCPLQRWVSFNFLFIFRKNPFRDHVNLKSTKNQSKTNSLILFQNCIWILVITYNKFITKLSERSNIHVWSSYFCQKSKCHQQGQIKFHFALDTDTTRTLSPEISSIYSSFTDHCSSVQYCLLIPPYKAVHN